MLSHRLHCAAVLIAGTVAFVGTAPAQPLSNASLKGAYNVRYLGANVDFNNPADDALSFSGTVTFDGNGNFTVTGQGISHAAGGFKLTPSGTYLVKPGGNFYMDNPFDPAKQAALFGGINPTTGTILASSTDYLYSDLLVGVAAGTNASASNLNGKYYISSLEFQGGNLDLTRNTFFNATANGSGSFGDWAIKGTAVNLKAVATSQTSPSVSYTLTANGTGTLNIPIPTGAPTAANQLLAGNKILYVSADGNLFVAGGASAYDMVIGIKAFSGNANTALTGLYFTGLVEYLADGGDGDGFYSQQGSSRVVNGTEIAHQRTLYEIFQGTFDFNFAGGFSVSPTDGTTTVPGFSNYVVGAGGNLVLGSGAGTNYQLSVYIKAPTTSAGTGVYLDPQGIVNAATFIPFTAQVAPGELVALFGSGLAASTVSAQSLPFPTTLNGVRVNLSWPDSAGKTQTKAAPIVFVSSGVIQILMPYGIPTDGTPVNFQVSNNNVTSNTAPIYAGQTSPGISTQTNDGLGNGNITHADNKLVTAANPAKVGETVVIYLTGLGAVTPAVADGAASPSPPATAAMPFVYIDGVEAKVLFAGLTPGSAGLYQLNVTIPAGVTAGQVVDVHIETADTDNIQATIPISK